jgi:hypothetical protein
MPRPKQIPTRPPLTPQEIAAACYVGSPEHKIEAWWGGLPEAWIDANGLARRPGKQHTTICRKTRADERDEASRWVREALINKQFKYTEGDKTFPKHIWYRDDAGQHWFGFAVNQILGTYKGWPVTEDEKREVFD